jgi:hypothetical protein
LSLSKGTDTVREGGADPSPGDDLSPVVCDVDGSAGRTDSAAIEDREKAGRVHCLACRSEKTLQVGIGGELLTRNQHPTAVPIELVFEAISMIGSTGRPYRDNHRNRHGSPRIPTAASWARQRQQSRAHGKHCNRWWVPTRPRTAHGDRGERQKPGFH